MITVEMQKTGDNAFVLKRPSRTYGISLYTFGWVCSTPGWFTIEGKITG